MKLVIGGYAQGKCSYVCEQWKIMKENVLDGELPENVKQEMCSDVVVIDHFQLWVKKRLEEGGNPEEEVMSFVDNSPNCIIISDELGNGIVPIDPFERAYRERTGRILITLAKRADEVERVICGIGQKLK